MKKIKIALLTTVATWPILSYAQASQTPLKRTRAIFDEAKGIVNDILIPLAFTLSLLFFFWGVAKYIRSAGDKEEGKKIMVWGVIAIFVISSIWGLVAFVQDEFDVPKGSASDVDAPFDLGTLY